MPHWFQTLKFKIVALAVVTGVFAAVGTAEMMLITTRAGLKQLLLQNEADERERTAALLSNKLDTLRLTLSAVAQRTTSKLWRDPAALTAFLEDKPALNVLYDSVLAASPGGAMLVRLVKGVPTLDLPNIADRDYFRQALATDQPVVSEPVVGRATKTPLLLIAVAGPAVNGKPEGVLVGSLALRSASLFSDLGGSEDRKGVRSLVVSRSGTVLAHPDPARVMGKALDEPGLGNVLRQWYGSGSPIDTEGTAVLSDSYMVSMAGIPLSDWVLVRLTPQSVALQPIMAAQRTAWLAAAAAGCVVALLAGGVAWFITRPISRLQTRAETLLLNQGDEQAPWPVEPGEVGALARAFQLVENQRQRRQGETQALLLKMEAVLDHAEVGIALTRDGHFEMVSRHFCHIFRCEKHQALGEPTRMIYGSDEAYQALSARAHPAFMQHGAFNGEVELVRRSGEPFWAQMRGRAVVPGDRSKGTIWAIEDVSEEREHRERLSWSASHDALTRLTNRPAFEALLDSATQHAATEPFCVMFIDLDRFKQVNDTGGHAAGDALLRDLAHQLVAQVRKSDTVARMGGDEFAVLLSQCPLSQAREIAEKLRAAVDGYRLAWEGHSFSVGTSIGLVAVDASYTASADVLRAADEACYTAKQRGRNCVAVFDEMEAVQDA